MGTHQLLDRIDHGKRFRSFERLVAQVDGLGFGGLGRVWVHQQAGGQHLQAGGAFALGEVPEGDRLGVVSGHQADAGDAGIKPADLVLDRAFVGHVDAGAGHPRQVVLEGQAG